LLALPLNQASARRYLLFSLIGLFIISNIIFIYFLNQEQRSLFTNLPENIAAGFTLGLCLLIIYRHKVDGIHDIAHMFLTLGVGLWFVAETIYTYYQLGLMITTPFPSLADPFYLAGYVFFAYYLYSIVKLLRKTIQRDVIILVSIAAAVSVTYILNLSFGIGFLLAEQEDMLGTMLSITYPILDSVLFVPAILVLWSMRKGDLAHTQWILISLFIIFNGIGDIGFGYGSVLGTIGREEWIWNMFFYAGYLTLASALLWQSRYHYSTSIIVRDNNNENVKENISNY
jgi:hypothetical protein